MPDVRRRAQRLLAHTLARANIAVSRARPLDLEDAFWPIHDRAREATMTSTARMYALWDALRYVERQGIEGAFVECGVWKGGSSMVAALTLQQLGGAGRDLWLYDTFEGMPAPTAADGDHAADVYRAGRRELAFAYSPLEEVRANMASTGWPAERLHLVEGKVEETIPGTMPDGPIALLRLDTDWYESTKHELEHLYPRLQPGGVLIIDDYGYWAGARRAVDEWLAVTADAPLLARIDDTGRLAVKPI